MKTGEACDRPRRPFGPLLIDWYRGESLDGRGGSVSRRDLNQLARKRAQLAGARKHEESVNSNPSYSSGGGPGEALLLEKRPPPEFLPVIMKGDFYDAFAGAAGRAGDGDALG